MTGSTTHIIGIDLSGPTNTRDTVLVAFLEKDDRLEWIDMVGRAGDDDILQATEELSRQGSVVVGLDAPLSYNPGGGDRPGDRDLRERISEAGLHPGSVMTPTMTRMAYLTLRGMSVARGLGTLTGHPLRVVEVHPGAAMALRGAAVDDIRSYKMDHAARERLLRWLHHQGVDCQPLYKEPDDHQVSACAAALAAWQWHRGNPAWLETASPPHHPFDFAC